MKYSRGLAVAALFASISLSQLGAAPPAAPPPPPTAPVLELTPRAGTLANRDLIVVYIADLTAAGKTEPLEAHVSDEGNVSLPYIGLLKLTGMTTDRAAQAIAKALGEEHIINDATVTVGILRPVAESKIHAGAVAKGDPLRVRVLDLSPSQPNFFLAVVGQDGKIVLPMIGEVSIEGTDEASAAALIKKMLKDQHLINDANVLVLRLEPDGKM